MSDLISRQAAIDAINKAETKECAIWVIKDLPSAEPTQTNVEPKKGKWIDATHSPFYCSECGCYQYNSTLEIMSGEYHFCPNCGAEMKGDEDE